MKLVDGTVREFLAALGSAAPVPGGGSASALAAALAAQLYGMVAQVTLEREPDKIHALAETAGALRALAADCETLVDTDADAYQAVRDAYRLPRSNEEEKAARALAVEQATRKAALVPLGLAEKCLELMQVAETVARLGRSSCISDAGVANFLALSAVMGGLLNVEANLSSMKDQEFVVLTQQRVSDLQERCRQAFDRLQEVVVERI